MKTLITCLFIFYSFSLLGQHPSTDSRWQLVFEDEFNGTSLNTTKWVDSPWWGRNLNYDSSTGDCVFLESPFYQPALRIRPPNSNIANGICTLTVKQVTPFIENYGCDGPSSYIYTPYTISHTSEMLQSVNNFKYGYYEIMFMMPANPPVEPNFNTFGPNFWLFGQVGDIRSEIDIYENFYANNNITYTSNAHYNGFLNNEEFFSITGIEGNQWHTAACNWMPDKIDYYIDNILVRTSKKNWLPFLSSMQIIIDINSPANIGTGNYDDDIPLSSSTVKLPYEYYISYVKVWQLEQDCYTNKTYCNNGPVTLDDTETFNEIYTGGNSCNTIFTEDISLKATNKIVLRENTTIPNGGVYVLDVNQCIDY